MRFCRRLLFAAGVAALGTVGVIAQAPTVPPPSEPVQFQPSGPAGPTAPLAPIGTPIPPVQLPTEIPAPPSTLPGATPPAPKAAPVSGPQTPQPAQPQPITPAPLPPQTGGTGPVTPTNPPQLVATPPTAPAPATGGVAPVLTVKQFLPESVTPGQAVTADVTVTNTGGKTAENVVLAGWWTTGYELTEASVAAQAVNGRQAWGLGAIPAGETRTLKVKLTPKAGTATAEFRSGFDATFSSATDTRAVKVLKPELQVVVEGGELAFVGQPCTLQLKVKNPSGVAVEKVFVKVELPETLSHPKGASLESEVAVLASGTTETIPLHLTGVKAGDGRVRVKVSAPGCDGLTHDVRVQAIEARLSVAVSGPKTLYQNWPATFEATIENQGDHPIKGASFDVKLPPGLADLRASDKPGHDAAGHRLVWKLDLAPGEKKTVFWFGFAKQAEDLTCTGAVTVSGTPLKRAEHTTKNLGPEGK